MYVRLRADPAIRKVMANLARKAGDLRDMASGPYTLSVLIDIIEKWDAIEEKDAGLSGINGNYTMLGMMGVPTFFVALLNEITLLKEEQAALLQIGSKELDEQGEKTRRALVAKHTRKIRDLVCPTHFYLGFNHLTRVLLVGMPHTIR
jgi:Zn-dependent M16 (insulinase) family peptidase